MNINIPDKIPKLLVLIGIIIYSLGYYNGENSDKEYRDKVDRFNVLIDSFDIEQMKVNNELKKLSDVAEDLSIQYSIENPIKRKDSITTSFNRIFTGEKNEVLVSDSINKLWEKQSKHSFNLKVLDKKIKLEDKKLKRAEISRDNYQSVQSSAIITGILFFVFGFIGWMIDEPDNLAIKQSEKIYRWCQSCGKSFSAVRKYGLEKDQTMNNAFCNDCYMNGEFTNPKLTEAEFINESMESVKSQNWFYKKLLKMRFKRLERWNANKY